MKKILVLGLSSILAIPFLSVAFVFAHGENSTDGHDTSVKPSTQLAQTTEGTAQTETETPIKPDDKSLQERIQKRKAELRIKLSAAEKLKIQNKCQASQGKVSSIKGRIKGIETSRGQVYSNITDHLKDLSEKLKNRGAETSELNTSITELETLIETFKTSLADYKLVIVDLEAMDCKTQPDEFKASLETARTALKKVNDDATAVKSYVKDNIKPLLKTIKASLEAEKQEGDE